MTHAPVTVTARELIGQQLVKLTFSDGAQRTRNLGPLLTGPVFEAIRADRAVFATVYVDEELGMLAWPSGPDIDADLLRYDDLWASAV